MSRVPVNLTAVTVENPDWCDRMPKASRRSLLLGTTSLMLGCQTGRTSRGLRTASPEFTGDAFVMSDGARLPLRIWRPKERPRTVVLALHGSNDSRDAWEIP